MRRFMGLLLVIGGGRCDHYLSSLAALSIIMNVGPARLVLRALRLAPRLLLWRCHPPCSRALRPAPRLLLWHCHPPPCSRALRPAPRVGGQPPTPPPSGRKPPTDYPQIL